MPDPDVRLVRDYIPALSALKGSHPPFTAVTPAQRDLLLLDKLQEEAEELAEAATQGEVVHRLAGVYETLKMIAASNDLTLEELEKAAQKIRAEKGGFERGFVVKES